MKSALTFLDIAHGYGELEVLRKLSFQIPAGDIFCLLGPSGCGKTTALRIAAGLERPYSGVVMIGERTVTSDSVFVAPEARGVGLLFQDYALFPHLTVERNVQFGLAELPGAEQRRRACDWLRKVGLWERRRDYPHMLSGGEQQRIALARALAPRPAVLLLDEPFSNLDSKLRFQVREDVRRTVKDLGNGTAVLMVTHDPEEALYMGDQIAVMEQGAILQLGAANDLYNQPATATVASLFGEVNRLQGRVEAGRVTTPLGSLPAGKFSEGAAVEVLVRIEGIQLVRPTEGAEQPAAVVTSVRRIGPVSQLAIELPCGDAPSCALKAHCLGLSEYRAGDSVTLKADPKLTFVFPKAR